MKKIFIILISFLMLCGFSFAQEYLFFYGNGCTHCAKVEKFFSENKVTDMYDIGMREIYFNRENLKEFSSYIDKLGISHDVAGVPFLVINDRDECNYLAGPDKIISFFQEKIANANDFKCNDENCPHLNCGEISSGDVQGLANNKPGDDIKSRRGFFGIMLPAALSDSINPCAFAVILLLLSSILIETKSKKRAILSGFLFALAIFLSYYGMGLGLYSALASSSNTVIIKRIVGILGILVGLANIKDFFRYGKGFVMEVPLSWRPKMQKMIKSVTSPIGAFIVGLLVSLFLLPCSSGPYITILGYLASESSKVNLWGYIYLAVYNVIFVLPMVVITLLVGCGVKSAEELAQIKQKNTKLIHLIVGLLMLGLGLYVLINL